MMTDKGDYIEFYQPDPLDILKEEIHQINCVSWLRHNHPRILFFHPVNENKKTMHTALKDAQSGLLKGVSDFVIMLASDKYPFAAIELKRTNKSGKGKASPVSKEQREFLRRIRELGGFSAVAYGKKQFELAIEEMLK